MVLQQLNILNYKNIADAQLALSPKINCLIGSNGEGKTNVLDAIYFLSFTKSATNSIDSLNVRHGEEMMMLQGRYDMEGAQEDISCGLKAKQKKVFRRNQKAYQRLTEHIGLIPLIMVSPADSELILGGSECRRRFMDSVIAQYDKTYLPLLSRYNRALQQRNMLLKQEDTPPSPEMLSLYEDVMAQCGESIYAVRQQFVEEFTPVFQRFYSRISGGHETVGLEYVSHCQRGPLLDVIQRDRHKDLAVGYSLHGIHKDDLSMTLDTFPIKREGSQGQSKTYLVSLKMAEFEFLHHAGRGTKPLLLLDDIFDKLDAQRVSAIIELVAEDSFGQIFITDTNRENLDRILAASSGDYKMFNVRGGVVTPITPSE